MSECVHIHVDGGATVVRPGDLLLITLAPGTLDQDFYDTVVESLKERLPEGSQFLIIEGDAVVSPAPVAVRSS